MTKKMQKKSLEEQLSAYETVILLKKQGKNLSAEIADFCQSLEESGIGTNEENEVFFKTLTALTAFNAKLRQMALERRVEIFQTDN